MRITIEVKREEDGRWFAVAREVRGAMLYGESPEDAAAKTEALALRVAAECIEHDDGPMGAFAVAMKTAREVDGRWRAELEGIPESASRGPSRSAAEAAAKARALRVVAPAMMAELGKETGLRPEDL